MIFPTDGSQRACMSTISPDALPPLKGSATKAPHTISRMIGGAGTPIGSAESDHSAHGKFSRGRAPRVCCYDKEARVWTHIWEQKSEERRAAAVPNFLKTAPRLPEQSAVGTCGDRHRVSQPSPPPTPTSSPGTRHILASPDKGKQERDLLQAQWQGDPRGKDLQGARETLPPPGAAEWGFRRQTGL